MYFLINQLSFLSAFLCKLHERYFLTPAPQLLPRSVHNQLIIPLASSIHTICQSMLKTHFILHPMGSLVPVIALFSLLLSVSGIDQAPVETRALEEAIELINSTFGSNPGYYNESVDPVQEFFKSHGVNESIADAAARIANGRNAPNAVGRRFARIFITLIGGGSNFCGGSVIGRQKILTSGSCIFNQVPNPDRIMDPSRSFIPVGRTNFLAETQPYFIRNIFLRQGFSIFLDQDISILRLNRNIAPGTFNVMSFATRGNQVPGVGGGVFATWFGSTTTINSNNLISRVQEGPLFIARFGLCRHIFYRKV